MIAPVILLSIAALVAHKPITVTCDITNTTTTTAVGQVSAEAYATVNGSDIHLTPALCKGINAPLTSFEFAHSLETVIHESFHTTGTTVEGCAEQEANTYIYDVLRQLYHVAFFTKLSQLIGANALMVTKARPAQYQLNTCTTQ